jgi:DNA repair protein RecO (recombination protein O)
MRIENQPAYVLHARAWRETSRIVEVLTRDFGRVAVVARGLAGAKRHAQRASLQPLQSVRLDYLPRGELARLLQVEAVDAAPALAGDALMAAFYANELLVRLCPRQDPQPGLWARYGALRGELAGPGPLAWTLRRFERDLLEALGVGPAWGADADGAPLDPGARYRVDAEHGALRTAGRDGIAGHVLVALAEDRLPAPDDLAALRPVLRHVLSAHLGAQPLRSWGLLRELARARDAGG